MTVDDRSLAGLLAERTRSAPDAVAAVFGAHELTFAELDERSSRLAGALEDRGVQPGDAVAVWLPNCTAWIELQFALAKLGALLVCVNTRYQSHELGGILQRSGARILVLQPEFRGIDYLSILQGVDSELLGGLAGVIVHGSERDHELPQGLPALRYQTLLEHERALPPDDVCHDADTACVAFTSSGSTGLPKLIVHAQRGITDHARSIGGRFYDANDAVALVTLPLCGVFGYATFMGALAAGRLSVVMDAFDAAEAVRLIEKHAVTTVTGPDQIMLRLLEVAERPEQLSSLREGGFAALVVDAEALVEQADGVGVSLFQCYGSSECQGLTARQPRGASVSERALGGGVPVSPATQVRVRSLDGATLEPVGVTGLLEIKGPCVMMGYLNQPDATAAALTADGFFKTGDLGYLMDDRGRFAFLSRQNDVLRLAGFLVEPREIEGFVEQLDAVAAASVVQVETDRGARAVVFVIAADGKEVAEEDVIAHCAASVAKYKVPLRVFTVDAFPSTPSANGEKVQRGKLRDRAEALLSAPADAPPAGR